MNQDSVLAQTAASDKEATGNTTVVLDARWYSDQFLAQVPRVLTLLDRDPSSRTYGCFDRNYWHYCMQDFPSLMYQELALVLAQAYALDLPGNRWRGQPRLRELAVAAVRFASHATRSDGSGDDYFPYERALGATAFVASASAETLFLLNERAPDLLAYLQRSCRWLLAHQEKGRLSNHQALVALAAARTARWTGDETLVDHARHRLELCLQWQHEEGWFAEYEGADLGYQSLTITFLATLREYLPGEKLHAALARAVRFAAHFLHPDGSFGGEIGSRNTCQVLPSGFERLAASLMEAAYLADGWLAGAMNGRRGYSDDDRIVSHWLQDFPNAYLARRAREANASLSAWTPPPRRTSFPAAHLHVIREGMLHLITATNKGGVFRAYRGPKLLRNDTGLVALDDEGRRLVTHVIDSTAVAAWEERSVTVRGCFHFAPRKLATPATQVVFRLINLTLGRFAPNLLRGLLQKLLITGKRPVPLRFERRVEWTSAGGVTVTDRLLAESGAPRLSRLFASTDATSIYVATSNVWKEASLQDWDDLTTRLGELCERGVVEIVREFK